MRGWPCKEKAADLTAGGFHRNTSIQRQPPNTKVPFMSAQWPGNEQKKV